MRVSPSGMGKPPEERLTPRVNAAIIPALLIAEVQEKQLAYRIVGLQVLILLVAAGIMAYGLEGTPQYAIAVLSGGGVSILNSLLLAWRMSRTSKLPHDAHHQLRLMYFYAVERFLAVVALLGICMAVLKFYPLAVLGGFVLGQAVLLVARLLLRIRTEGSLKNVQ